MVIFVIISITLYYNIIYKLVGARPLRGRNTHPILIHPSQH